MSGEELVVEVSAEKRVLRHGQLYAHVQGKKHRQHKKPNVM
jgi:hypothetical protein